MSPVQSIPPTVTIALPLNNSSSNNNNNTNNNNNSHNAPTGYYNTHNIIEKINNNNKYNITTTTNSPPLTPPPILNTRIQRARKVMSDALSISNITQKQMAYEPTALAAPPTISVSHGSHGAVSVEQSAVAAVAAAAAYQFNYNHLYADRAAVAAAMYGHGPPIMFSAPQAQHPMFTVSTPVAAHAYKLNNNNNANNNNNNNSHNNSNGNNATMTDSNTVFSSAYLKAIQNAVTASIFNPTQQQQKQQQLSSLSSQILTPPTPTPTTLAKSPTLLADSMSSLAVSSSAATSPTIVSSNHSNNSNSHSNANNKTYLNEKSISVKNMTTAEVNYFKVPSGKEGSLKHRILTRPQNVHAQNLSTTTTNKSSLITPTSTTTTTNNNNNNNTNTSNSLSNGEEHNSNGIMRTYDSTSNFRRGSYIELANGVLRKVEDMRTEDFIQCAERSPQHKLAESTVVKIDLTPANTVIITFSYDNNHSRADVEVSHDHPFFVYGQGWASYNPEASAQVFGLKCQRLQVGDICISLTIRECETSEVTVPAAAKPTTTTKTSATAMNMTMSASAQASDYGRYQMSAADHYANSNVLPLSPHTPPAALVSSTSSHLGMPPTHFAGGLPYHMLPYTSAEMADLVSAYAYHAHHMASTAAAQPPSNAKVLNSHPYYGHHPHQHHPQSPHIYHSDSANMSKENHLDYKHYAAHYDAAAAAAHAHHVGFATDASHFITHPHQHHNSIGQHQHQMHQPQEEPVDATIARKRRWSAPEGVCDDDEDDNDVKHQPVRLASVSSSTQQQHNNNYHHHHQQQQQHHHHPQHHSSSNSNMYKIFKPAPVVAAAPPP